MVSSIPSKVKSVHVKSVNILLPVLMWFEIDIKDLIFEKPSKFDVRIKTNDNLSQRANAFNLCFEIRPVKSIAHFFIWR